MTKNSEEKLKYEECETSPLSKEVETEKADDISTIDYKGLDTGWAWVVLFASFGTFCLLGSSLYSVGIIQSVLLQKYKESVTLTSWPGALNTAMMSLGGTGQSNILFVKI